MTTIPSVRTDPLAIDAARSPILNSVSVPFPHLVAVEAGQSVLQVAARSQAGFLPEYVPAEAGQHDADPVAAGQQSAQEPERVQSAAGAGDGDDDMFHDRLSPQ